MNPSLMVDCYAALEEKLEDFLNSTNCGELDNNELVNNSSVLGHKSVTMGSNDVFDVPCLSHWYLARVKRHFKAFLVGLSEDELSELFKVHGEMVVMNLLVLLISNHHVRATSFLGYQEEAIDNVNSGSIFKIENKLVLSSCLTKNQKRNQLNPEEYLFIKDDAHIIMVLLLNQFHHYLFEELDRRELAGKTQNFYYTLFRYGGFQRAFNISTIRKDISQLFGELSGLNDVNYYVLRKIVISFQSEIKSFESFKNETRSTLTTNNHSRATMSHSYVQLNNLPLGFSNHNYGYYVGAYIEWKAVLREAIIYGEGMDDDGTYESGIEEEEEEQEQAAVQVEESPEGVAAPVAPMIQRPPPPVFQLQPRPYVNPRIPQPHYRPGYQPGYQPVQPIPPVIQPYYLYPPPNPRPVFTPGRTSNSALASPYTPAAPPPSTPIRELSPAQIERIVLTPINSSDSEAGSPRSRKRRRTALPSPDTTTESK